MATGLDTAAVVARAGISARRLGHWDRLGIVSPSISPARGSGSRRIYSNDDLAYVLLVNEVRQFGATLELAMAVTSAVRSVHHKAGSIAGMRVVAAPEQIQFCGKEGDQFSTALAGVGGAMVLNLDVFVREAERLCAQPSQPSTVVVEIGGEVLQVVVLPQVGRGKPLSFIATCRAYAGLSGTGGTQELAVLALKDAIESTERAESRPEESLGQPPRPTQSGASAWGGEW